MQRSFIKFLEELNTPKRLREIRQEEERRRQGEGSKGKDEKPRKKTLLDYMHEYDQEHECKKSARLCLIAIAVNFSNKTNYKKIIGYLEQPLRALTEPNLNMVDQYFSKVNEAYKDKFGTNSAQHVWSKKTLHLTPEEKNMKNKEASSRRMEKNVNPQEIMDTQVYNLILKGQALDAGWKDKFIAIALSCGARLIEIASPGVSKFSESKDAPGQLHQEGVAKDEHGTEVRGAKRLVDKPIIQLQVQELLKMIEDARRLLKEEKESSPEVVELLERKEDLTSDQKKLITNRINAPLNERVREVMGQEYHFHTLRAIYGNLSYQLFGSNMSINAWLSRVLGHKPGSLSTAASYSTITITKKLPQEHTDIKDRVTELTEQINVLKAELEKSKEQVMEEAKNVVEKKIENENLAKIKLFNEEGGHVIFTKQPRLHDGKQRDRLLRTVAEMERKKVRINWPNLRMLGYGDKIISDYFKSVDKSPREYLPDQRRTYRKHKADDISEEGSEGEKQ